MKKFLLLGACVASIAVSSSALAAVTYGDESNLAVEVNSTETAVSVTSGLPTEGQATVLVVKGNNPATIAQGDILFIDQDAAGTATFAKDMGLLLKAADGSTLEKLPAGTYTVKVGGDKVTAIAVKTFTVTDSTTPDVGTDIIWGDINQDGEVTDSDSIAILSGIVGTANKGTFQVYDNMKAVTGGTEFIWGDINQDGEITDSDSIAILSGIVGTANKGTYQVYDTFKATKK